MIIYIKLHQTSEYFFILVSSENKHNSNSKKEAFTFSSDYDDDLVNLASILFLALSSRMTRQTLKRWWVKSWPRDSFFRDVIFWRSSFGVINEKDVLGKSDVNEFVVVIPRKSECFDLELVIIFVFRRN